MCPQPAPPKTDFLYFEDMNVPCRDGRFLHDMIVEKDYKRGLEIGSFTGYSALWLGMTFRKTEGRSKLDKCR